MRRNNAKHLGRGPARRALAALPRNEIQRSVRLELTEKGQLAWHCPNPIWSPNDQSTNGSRPDLLRRMTLAEKAGMLFHTMVMITPDGDLNIDMGAFGGPSIRELTGKHITHFNLVGSASAEKIAAWTNQLQELAAGKRLGIPITFSTDPRHSFAMNPGAHMTTQAFSDWPEPFPSARSRRHRRRSPGGAIRRYRAARIPRGRLARGSASHG